MKLLFEPGMNLEMYTIPELYALLKFLSLRPEYGGTKAFYKDDLARVIEEIKKREGK